MTGMLNLRDILELINHGFDNRPAAEQDAIGPGDQLVLITAHGNEVYVEQGTQGLRQGVGNIPFVAEEFAKQGLGQAWDRLTVIHIAGREAKLQKFALIVHHQVQFEAKKPASRGLPPRCQASKHFVAMDALIRHTSSEVESTKEMPVQRPRQRVRRKMISGTRAEGVYSTKRV